MMQNKILLFGKTGQLGWELERALSTEFEVYAYSSQQVDVKDLQNVEKKIEEIKPTIIINASAYTAVDQAEIESETAMRINAEAPACMAECAQKIKAVFIHYSTDYVFDGKKNITYTEKDLTNPLNMYGKSKLSGEQAVGRVGGAFIILRTSWGYSMRGDNFVTKVIAWAQKGNPLKIVTDQIGSPTWSRSLAQATTQMIERGKLNLYDYFSAKSGIYHLGGAGSVSRFDFAKEILRLSSTGKLGADLKPALTSDFPTPAIRPLYTPLDCTKFETTFDIRLPKWQESLQMALKEYYD